MRRLLELGKQPELWICGVAGVPVGDYEGGYDELSLQFVLGLLFSPVAWLVGVSWENTMSVGQLLGERLVLNEFFAYDTLSKMRAAGTISDHRSVVIASYAICGFANLVSMGIQVGGIGALAPSQRTTLAALAGRAVLGGTIACLMTASIAAFLVSAIA